MGRGVIVIGEKRSGHDEQNKTVHQGETPKKEMRTENHVEKVAQDEEDAKVTRNPTAFHFIQSKIKALETNNLNHILHPECSGYPRGQQAKEIFKWHPIKAQEHQ